MKTKNCKKCKENNMFSAAVFQESMKHWDDPNFRDRAYSHVFREGEKHAMWLLIKAIAVLILIAAIVKILIAR